MSLYLALRRRWSPAALALQGDGIPGRIHYGELDLRARKAAGALHQLGVRPGQVVALQAEKGLPWLEVHLGALALGAITLPLGDRHTPSEIAWTLKDARATLAVGIDPAAAGEIPTIYTLPDADPIEPVPLDDHALAALLYTSGTTGRPKGAMLTQANLRAGIEALHQAWGWSARDRLLHALPLFHVHGLFVACHGALWAGASQTWMGRFDAAAAMALLPSHSIFMGVPTFYHRFLQLEAAPDLSALRLFTSGSAPLPAADHQAFARRFGHQILERYGMTEVGIVLSNPLDGPRLPGTVGFPLPGVEARITRLEDGAPCAPEEVGEIRIRGPSVMAGYLGRPAETAEAIGDGWMHTGDLGRMDPSGRFTVVGRHKELVISGGFNIYPAEVEAVLVAHPGVMEAAVVGRPDADLGERVVAYVVGEVSVLEILAFAAERLAPYKRPREVHLVAALPRNAMGKVQKHLLGE